VASLDDQIDDLYRLPLAEFTSARNLLAKSLTGDAAKRVKALAKPTVVPWAVNQVYWRARATYDRLIKSGERLRAAQIAALEGRPSDAREADAAHRRAIAAAVAEAERMASAGGSQPGADALTRTFEALSLAATTTGSPGRLTEPLQPAGFEALLGITPAAPPVPGEPVARPQLVARPSGGRGHAEPAKRTAAEERKARLEEERERERQQAAAEEARKHAAEIKLAEAALTKAEAVEREARATWETAHETLIESRRELARLKSELRSVK
jgi:hypothetical protein